jgi:glycosyltransferase involved in cell wall biosynthesis
MPEIDVTVVTPTRNRPPLLECALDSIRRQAFQNYEVFVIDDGSEEQHAVAYRKLIGRFDDRFRLLQPLAPGQKTGSGPAVSRNRGIEAGRGRYIAFLDDDDVWTWGEHLAVAVAALDATRVDVYCADMQGFRGDQLLISSWFPDHRPLLAGERIRNEPAVYRCPRHAFVEAASHRVVHPNMLVIRRALLERIGGFLVSLRYAEDTEFVLRLADRSEWLLFCPEVVARYRLPEGTAHSLTMSSIDQDWQTLAAAQHMKLTAVSPEVQRAARSIESWTLRLLSRSMKRQGRIGTAMQMAIQAFVAWPSLGSLRHVAATLVPDRVDR